MYKVFVTIPFGIDDTYYCEYTGVVHNNINSAYKEALRAKNDDTISVVIEHYFDGIEIEKIYVK